MKESLRQHPIRSKTLRQLVFVLLVFFSAQLLLIRDAVAAATPLEQSGLGSVWQENFANGSIDRMQYTWSKGNNAALTSFVMPGAVYMGKNGGTIQIEQEINNFKMSSGEAMASTLEFDVFSPNTGKGRVSLRPRRRGDMVTFLLGLAGDKTKVSFREDVYSIAYSVPTGPSRGWAHIVISYRQFLQSGTLRAHYVVAINEEVHEHQNNSGITDPDYETYWNTDPNADGWSIEHNSTEVLMGKYIANVRAYSAFLTLLDMQSRLQGRVSSYVASLPDPRNYSGPVKTFQGSTNLVTHGPNPRLFAAQVGPLTYNFDGSLSSDWDKITAYNWDWGDGQTGSGRLVSHTYDQNGTYNVKLSVTSDAGTKSGTISVSTSGSATATSTSVFTPTFTRTPTNILTPANTPTATNTPVNGGATNTPTFTPTNTRTNTPTRTATNTPTRTPTSAPAATNTPTRTATPSGGGGGNLLVNPGFELDADNNGKPDGWTNTTTFFRSSDQVHGGSFAGKHSATTDASYNANQTIGGVTPGTTYNFSGWVNIPATSDTFSFTLDVRWRDSTGNSLRTDVVKTFTAATGGWNQATGSFAAPANAASAMVRMVVSSLNGTIYVDDFSFGP